MLKNVRVTRVITGVTLMLLISACTPQHAADQRLYASAYGKKRE